MVRKKRKIIWDSDAVNHLHEIYEYVKKVSLQGANKIRSEILATTKTLPVNPEIFALDLLKENNDGTYRVFYIYSYRVVYRITEENILILRIRHTSREPEVY